MEGQITFAKASSIKFGDYFCIGTYPCKCVQMDTSKPGKHGACKIHFVGIDILTGKKHDLISPSTKDVTVLVVTKKEYLLLDLMNEEDKTGNDIAYCSLMYQCKTCDNIKLPDSDIG